MKAQDSLKIIDYDFLYARINRLDFYGLKDTKLGLAFFADRDHDFNVPMEELYGVGLNMKSVKDITRSEIDTAWSKINLMGGGGDGPEGKKLSYNL